MLVEMIDGIANRIAEAKCPGDVGAAGAAGDDQFLRDQIAVRRMLPIARAL